jgi:hypothetical protein
MKTVRCFERYEDNIDNVTIVNVQTAGYIEIWGVYYLTSVIWG